MPFLLVYHSTDGGGGWQTLNRPLWTMTTLDRFRLVRWDGGEPTWRMPQVPELERAMGFPPSYKLLHGSRRDRIKLLANGVCPPVMQAIVSAAGVSKAIFKGAANSRIVDKTIANAVSMEKRHQARRRVLRNSTGRAPRAASPGRSVMTR